MKKFISLLLVLMLVISLAACKNGEKVSEGLVTDASETVTNENEGNATSETSDEIVTVEIFQSKVEFVDQLDALIADFEKEYPNIDIIADTVGGGGDYGGAFRTRITSGNEPDIFNADGPTAIQTWREYYEPLNDQPWVENAFSGTLDMVTDNGEILGMPYNIEGYGIAYNIDIFEAAGIDAKAIDTLSELRAAFETLEAKKDVLGIETPLSFSMGDSAWWTAAIHNFNIPFAMQEDPYAYVAGLNDGSLKMIDNDRMLAYLDLLDLFFEYSYEDLLTVSYDDQVTNFAIGKTATLHQGNWTAGMLDEINPDLNIAYLPIPISDDADWNNDSIPVGVPNYWCVNKKSSEAEKTAAKLFLDYIASSERGAKFLVEDSNFIPAFSNITLEPKDDLSKSILEYSAAGKTIPWTWVLFPSGYLDPFVKEAMQRYYVGDIDREELLQSLQDKWTELLE